MTCPRTRAERERINRQFSEWFLLPFIGKAVARAGIRGDAALSAALSEIETIRELHHLLGRKRGRP
jgi:hypothetical protein